MPGLLHDICVLEDASVPCSFLASSGRGLQGLLEATSGSAAFGFLLLFWDMSVFPCPFLLIGGFNEFLIRAFSQTWPDTSRCPDDHRSLFDLADITGRPGDDWLGLL